MCISRSYYVSVDWPLFFVTEHHIKEMVPLFVYFFVCLLSVFKDFFGACMTLFIVFSEHMAASQTGVGSRTISLCVFSYCTLHFVAHFGLLSIRLFRFHTSAQTLVSSWILLHYTTWQSNQCLRTQSGTKRLLVSVLSLCTYSPDALIPANAGNYTDISILFFASYRIQRKIMYNVLKYQIFMEEMNLYCTVKKT